MEIEKARPGNIDARDKVRRRQALDETLRQSAWIAAPGCCREGDVGRPVTVLAAPGAFERDVPAVTRINEPVRSGAPECGLYQCGKLVGDHGPSNGQTLDDVEQLGRIKRLCEVVGYAVGPPLLDVGLLCARRKEHDRDV